MQTAQSQITEGIYLRLLESPGDYQTMLVLSDSLEEEDKTDLAEAYRYAACNRKWPFLRIKDQGAKTDPNVKVYDWERLGRIVIPHSYIPQEAQLPINLYNVIRNLKDKQYGGVHEAFVLLARGLVTLKEKGLLI